MALGVGGRDVRRGLLRCLRVVRGHNEMGGSERNISVSCNRSFDIG